VTVTLGGCKPLGLNAGGGSGGGGGGGSTTGNLIIWTNTNQGAGAISVTVNGEYGSVSSFYSSNSVNNPPSCGSAGCANFTLAPGAYSMQASDASGSSWSGSITVYAGGCSSFMLQ
jgi:hypothetical protein